MLFRGGGVTPTSFQKTKRMKNEHNKEYYKAHKMLENVPKVCVNCGNTEGADYAERMGIDRYERYTVQRRVQHEVLVMKLWYKDGRIIEIRRKSGIFTKWCLHA